VSSNRLPAKARRSVSAHLGHLQGQELVGHFDKVARDGSRRLARFLHRPQSLVDALHQLSDYKGRELSGQAVLDRQPRGGASAVQFMGRHCRLSVVVMTVTLGFCLLGVDGLTPRKRQDRHLGRSGRRRSDYQDETADETDSLLTLSR
jgi:hypothetical protein